MLFNSLNFVAFLPFVFILHWLFSKRSAKYQNLILTAASYFFYACWDWRFLFLLVFSTLLDYFVGIKIYQSKKEKIKKTWFWLSIGINLGFLGVFKYYNFFADSFADALTLFGVNASPVTLQIILPVGISFYTFHGLSYIIDIYKRKIKPEYNFITYALFVSFFPLLVAGPIERATHLLPQIKKPRSFNYSYATDGMRQILWGFFKKVVIADNCGAFADIIFNSSSDYSGSTLLLGAIFFAFQIYGDFSGYSDIAIGTAKLFGIELLRNFAYPYFSRNIVEFWRRWHISLSTWFRDYIYIPLGGSRGSTWQKVRNTFVIFILSGFWHGANWTFIVWGIINAIYILPSLLFKTSKTTLHIAAEGHVVPSLKELISIGLTFMLTVFAWIFFRAPSLEHAFKYLSGIFNSSLFSLPDYPQQTLGSIVIIVVSVFILVEWLGREHQYPIAKLNAIFNRPARWAIYYCILLIIFIFGGSGQQFIYFQF